MMFDHLEEDIFDPILAFNANQFVLEDLCP